MFPFSVARHQAVEPLVKTSEPGNLFARAPNLRESGELAVASIVKNLQTMAGPVTTIEGVMAGFALGTPRNVVAAHRVDAVIGSILVPELSCMILASLDGTLVHAIVELLCGGNGVEPQSVEPRPVTPIDQQFAQIILTLAASAVQIEWAAAGFSSARAANINGLLTADIFGPRVDEVGIVDITISIFGLHGTLRLVLPPAALDRFADEATDDFEVEAPDMSWANELQRELGRTPVAVSAYLEAKDIPLGSLAGLQIGQILRLPADARSRAVLVSDGAVLCRGEIGRDDSHYSLRIDEFVRESVNVARMAVRSFPNSDLSKG